MIPDNDDPNEPRMLRITITDQGAAWEIDIQRNRIQATDDDVCSLIAEAGFVLDQMHSEAHVAKDLAKRLN